MPPKNILIYNAHGAQPACAQETFASFQKFFGNSHQVQLVSANYLNKADWEQETDLIIIPGGRSLPYYRALRNGGNKKIINFVKQGGKFLGICAGAYYASATTEFEKGNELEVINKGPLNFFPGVAAGPANGLGKFRYEGYAGAEVITIKWLENAENYRVFFQGGCYFVDAANYAKVRVLASYAELPENPAAIIECQVGKGKAILSGVHFEFSSRGINVAEECGHDLAARLKKIELQREQLFKNLTKHF